MVDPVRIYDGGVLIDTGGEVVTCVDDCCPTGETCICGCTNNAAPLQLQLDIGGIANKGTCLTCAAVLNGTFVADWETCSNYSHCAWRYTCDPLNNCMGTSEYRNRGISVFIYPDAGTSYPAFGAYNIWVRTVITYTEPAGTAPCFFGVYFGYGQDDPIDCMNLNNLSMTPYVDALDDLGVRPDCCDISAATCLVTAL